MEHFCRYVTYKVMRCSVVPSYNPPKAAWDSGQVNLLLRGFIRLQRSAQRKSSRFGPSPNNRRHFPEVNVKSHPLMYSKLKSSTQLLTMERSAPVVTDLDLMKRHRDICKCENWSHTQVVYFCFPPLWITITLKECVLLGEKHAFYQN